jgi:hypothetical protein
VLAPAGTRIALTGGTDCNDHKRIWAVLDKVRAKHPDMVLLHGGSPRGAERIAACWADNRKVAQVVFKPDWTRHRNAAPFKRNDQMLDVLPIGGVVFPGSGISANLADKAMKLGIPVWRFNEGGALGAASLSSRSPGPKVRPAPKAGIQPTSVERFKPTRSHRQRRPTASALIAPKAPFEAGVTGGCSGPNRDIGGLDDIFQLERARRLRGWRSARPHDQKSWSGKPRLCVPR